MNSMMKLLGIIHTIVWGPWTMVIFLGTGLYLSVRIRFFQVSGIKTWWKATAGSLVGAGDKNREKGITSFQSACTALAATIGTGNIVGVATALTAGGPGALVWMWVSAGIGMATAYVETALGQHYRYRRPEGSGISDGDCQNSTYLCGPMIYMERGLACPVLGIFYAAVSMFSSLGMGSMVQSNSISETLHFSFGLPGWLNGLLLTGLVAAVIVGGAGRIARFSEKLMPAAAGIYIFFSAFVILSCMHRLPGVLKLIISDAFHPMSAAGGISGYLFCSSVRYGLSRGVFSNEAGLGSLAILHGGAEHTTAHQQGMWAMFEVFLDTMIICTMTALVILCVTNGQTVTDGAALAAWCFSKKLGMIGELLVSGSMVVFAFATIVAWYYLGSQTVTYLSDRLIKAKPQNHIKKERCIKIYRVLYLCAVFAGCVAALEPVWLLSDIWNALMAYPNLLTLVILAGEVSVPVIRSEKTLK